MLPPRMPSNSIHYVPAKGSDGDIVVASDWTPKNLPNFEGSRRQSSQHYHQCDLDSKYHIGNRHLGQSYDHPRAVPPVGYRSGSEDLQTKEQCLHHDMSAVHHGADATNGYYCERPNSPIFARRGMDAMGDSVDLVIPSECEIRCPNDLNSSHIESPRSSIINENLPLADICGNSTSNKTLSCCHFNHFAPRSSSALYPFACHHSTFSRSNF